MGDNTELTIITKGKYLHFKYVGDFEDYGNYMTFTGTLFGTDHTLVQSGKFRMYKENIIGYGINGER